MAKQAVGGQAVIEGVMMQSKDKRAVAVRKSDGEIALKEDRIKSWVRDKNIDKIPFVRGSFVMIDTMIQGIKSLNFSSEFFMEEAEEDKFDLFIKKIFKDKANDIIIIFSLVIAMLLSAGLFIFIPTLVGGAFSKVMPNDFMLNLIEGIIRIAILFVYIVLISRSKDIERVFQYHGAEHKSIYCYENDLELTVENARKFKRLHPRCGTNFLFIVMAVSIILFAFFGWPNPILRIFMRIICVPIVAGLSYEVIRILGRYDNGFTKVIAYPGMMLQYFTTKEPDDEQLEVALEALKAVVD
ncbi:membrane protein [Clostridioides difficile]|nr:membrane protein [Clostridioides difficile]